MNKVAFWAGVVGLCLAGCDGCDSGDDDPGNTDAGTPDAAMPDAGDPPGDPDGGPMDTDGEVPVEMDGDTPPDPGDAEVDGGDPPETCDWEPFNQGLSGGATTDVLYGSSGTVYASSGGSFLSSDDSGATWTRVATPDPLLGSLVDGGDLGLFSAGAGGLQVSTDDGATWSTFSQDGVPITSFLIHPASNMTMFAAVMDSGLLRSSNGGAAWIGSSNGIPFSRIMDMDGDPDDVDRTLLSLIELNASGGFSGDGAILKTENGGMSWSEVYSGARVRNIERCGDTSTDLWAGGNDGVLFSDDDGESWDTVGDNDDVGARVVNVAVASDCSVIYASREQPGGGAMSLAGLYRSTDDGATWTGPLTAGLPYVERVYPNEVRVDPADGMSILALFQGGTLRSSDGGDTWQTASNLGTVQLNDMSISADNPDKLWLATRGSGVWTREGFSTGWQPLGGGVLPVDRAFSVNLSPSDGDQVLIGTGEGTFNSEGDIASFEQSSNEYDLLAAGYQPGTDVVIGGTQVTGVVISDDGGDTWDESNAGLTAWDTGNGTFIDVRAVAFDPAAATTVFIGTNGSGIYRSDDSGENWVAESAGVDDDAVFFMATGGGQIYAGVEERGVLVRRAQDNWEFVNDGLGNLLVSSLFWDATGQVLYAATEMGVYVFDATAESWSKVGGTCTGPVSGRIAVMDDGMERKLISSSVDGLFSLDL